jgi:hypothetical protein
MKSILKVRALSSICACFFVLVSTICSAELFDRGGGFIYDDVLDVTWTQSANLPGRTNTWDNHVAWVSDLTLHSFDDWRLPNADVNGDNVIVDCSIASAADCADNELGYQYWQNGISSTNFGPFVNIISGTFYTSKYCSGTTAHNDSTRVAKTRFDIGTTEFIGKSVPCRAWAVHDGDVANDPNLLAITPVVVGTMVDYISTIQEPDGAHTGQISVSVQATYAVIQGTIEFDVSSVALPISHASLNLVVTGVSTNQSRPFDVYGYVGDGLMGLRYSPQGLNDWSAGTLIANAFSGTAGFGPVSIDVTSFINNLPAGTNFAGFNLRTQLDGNVLVFSPADIILEFVVAPPDSDGDGIPDDEDNAPNDPNPDQSDVDEDGVGDVADPCPADPLDECDPDGSAAEEASVDEGGTVATPDGQLELDIDPGDLAEDTTISITETVGNDPEVDLSVGANAGLGQALAFYDLEPDGLQFDSPITLSIVVDVSGLNESQRTNLDVYRYEDTDSDGLPDTFVSLGAVCNVIEDPAGTFIADCSVQVDHFSSFAIVVPQDSDGDGVPDDFAGQVDACPLEDATGLDVDNDGCIDSFSGLLNLLLRLQNEAVISEQMVISLTSKVANAENSFDKDGVCTAVNQIDAFKNQVAAQTGNKISAEAASQVIAYADGLIGILESQLPIGEGC